MKQIAVMGETGEELFEQMIKAVRAEHRPGVMAAASAYPPSMGAPALLHERKLVDGKATAYICEGFVCKYPINNFEIFTTELNK